jgi:hypothetical protein
MTIIKDGSGTGNEAKVDTDNRLYTKADVTDNVGTATLEGDAFVVSSSIVNLTTSCCSQILYLKNNECIDIVLTEFSIIMGNTTGGAGDFILTFTFCPTGGTIVCCGTVGGALNFNLGSASLLASDVRIGAEGSTIIGGAGGQDLFPNVDRYTVPTRITLTKGDSLSIGIQPPAGNTNVNVSVGAVLFRQRNG